MYSAPIRTTPGPAKGGADETEITGDDAVSAAARVEFSCPKPSYIASCTFPPESFLGTPLRAKKNQNENKHDENQCSGIKHNEQ